MKIIEETENSLTVIHKEPIRVLDKYGDYYIFNTDKPIIYKIHECHFSYNFIVKFNSLLWSKNNYLRLEYLPLTIQCNCGQLVTCGGDLGFQSILQQQLSNKNKLLKIIALYWGSIFEDLFSYSYRLKSLGYPEMLIAENDDIQKSLAD